MERQPKIDSVIKAIEKAKAITPKGQEVKVYLPNVLKNKQIRVQELYNILSKLEDDEKIITLMHFPSGLFHIRDGWGKIYPPEEFDLSQEYFTLKVRRSFDKWCANYWKLAHEGQIKWTKEDAIRCITELKSPFELLPERQSKQPANLKQDFSSILSQQDSNAALHYIGEDPEGFRKDILKVGQTPSTEVLLKKMGGSDDFITALFTPNEFENELRSLGHTPETEMRLKALYPNLTPKEVDQVFNPSDTSPVDKTLRRRKPKWAETNVPWETKKVIWLHQAKGDTVSATKIFLELNQGEYVRAPLDLKTISKVREELDNLPDELAKTLIKELPEIKDLIEQKG